MDKLKLSSRSRKAAVLCPCGKSNKDGKFVPFEGYIDKGFCHACDRTFTPQQTAPIPQTTAKEIAEPASLLPFPKDIVKLWSDISQCHKNPFLLGLKLFFGYNAVEIAKKYNIGYFDFPITEPNEKMPLNRYNGCTIFFYKDAAGYYQSGKIMRYNAFNLKREKTVFNWLHSIYATLLLRYPESNQTHTAKEAAAYSLNPCFFGEHLLWQYPKAKIAIVESEKTAIIANESGYFPDVLFLAAGGNSGYAIDKFKPLKNRQILILPDNDILLDNDKRTNLENKVKQLQSLKYAVSIWADLPKLYNGINAEKADLADVLLNDRAVFLWSELAEHREELAANGFKLLL